MMVFTLLPLILPSCFLDEESTLRILPGSFTRLPISNTVWIKERRISANACLHAEPIVSRQAIAFPAARSAEPRERRDEGGHADEDHGNHKERTSSMQPCPLYVLFADSLEYDVTEVDDAQYQDDSSDCCRRLQLISSSFYESALSGGV